MHLLPIFLSLAFAFGKVWGTNECVQFEKYREVSDPDSIQVISNHSGTSREELVGLCAPRCLRDIECNAFDICYGSLQCRTIRGWTPTGSVGQSGDLCQRHHIECAEGYYYSRTNGSCLIHDRCDFETGETSCFLSEAVGDSFDWSRITGATSSYDTGPTSAYSGLYYKYIETSSYVDGDAAILQSSKSFQDKTYCLTLHYHMYGATTESLAIQTQKENEAPITHWIRSGNQGNTWHQLSGVSLHMDPQTKILISATHGTSYTGDIAIDYVELWPFACP
ncbi:MAM domain-containing glycosylphosphatidylinositol anchor protein 1-like [Saccostrea cucullata]|uniref:MAM domain-containing glycosylphosphatidylinositol anchor protein 1-like n=1 Tax=Saccostrea cuccullata TaxID=36930 RepID=UPI002ED1F409